jgi:5-methylcytosine-specific restriction endonuclease McrA
MEKTCTKCLKTLPLEMMALYRNRLVDGSVKVGVRGVCKPCDNKSLNVEKRRESGLRSFHKKMKTPEERERYNKKCREYRAKRKSEGNPLKRNCKSDSLRVNPLKRKKMKEAVLSEKGFSCAYCGSNEKLTVDHVVPLSRGGTSDLSNLVPCCFSCNSSKGNKTANEWIEYNLKRGIKRCQ